MSDLLTRDVLVKAKALISDPECWTQRAFARDKADLPLGRSNGKTAVRWCAVGACQKVAGSSSWGGPHQKALDECAIAQGFTGSSTLNDYSDHETVMAMFDCAIERAES